MRSTTARAPRRSRNLLATTIGLALAAFAGASVAGSDADATESTTAPVVQSFWVPCALDGAGELVTLSGELHLTTQTVQRSATQWLTVTGVNPQGVIGTGEVSGDVYRGTGHTGARTISTAAGERLSQTSSFGLVGPGPQNNLTAHTTWHITEQADGSILGTVDKVSVECR